MSKVMIDKVRLDDLAEKIGIKSKTKLPLTITGMINAVQSIYTKDEIQLQDKIITPTVSYQTITFDENYDGLSKVKLNIAITNQNSLFTSGRTVYVPAGYYNTQVSKSVQTMSLPTTSTPTSKGDWKATITPGTSNKYINIPYGYNTTCAYYTIAGDSNLTSANIINGKSIFGVQGSAATTTTTLVATSVTPLTTSVTITPTSGYGFSTVTVAAITPGVSGTPIITTSAVVNNTITVKPTVTNTTGYITGGTITGSSITISAAQLVSGTKSISANGTNIDVTNYAKVNVNVPGGQEGGGESELPEIQTDTKTTTLSAESSSIQFTGLSDEPTSFVVISTDDVAMVSGIITAIVYDGTYLHGQTLTTQVEASTDFNKSYSNGTLTITGGNSQFQTGTYKLIYSYEGSTTDVHTSDIQVGSGATSITFSGLSGTPLYWSCIFKSNFSTSSGYQRVIAVANDGTSTFGLDMDSSAHADTAWTAAYNNGTLTLTSQGTNAGGYFHQPGYYQLTYVTNEQIEVVSSAIDTKTVSASNSYPNSISFTNMLGEPKMFVCRCDTSISASGNTTYYYIINMTYNGTNTKGSYFRIGSTRQVVPVSSGYSWTYNNNTLTLTSSANDRSASPGTFYYGTYELIYAY